MKKYSLVVTVILSGSVLCAKTRLPAIERVHKKLERALESAKQLSGKDFQQLVKTGAVVSELQANDVMATLYWSNQRDFVGILGQLKRDDVYRALEHLTNKIYERYVGAQYPLFKFIEELTSEELTLNNLAAVLTQKQQNPLASTSKRDELKMSIEKHTLLSHLLQELLAIVHDLLTHRL